MTSRTHLNALYHAQGILQHCNALREDRRKPQRGAPPRRISNRIRRMSTRPSRFLQRRRRSQGGGLSGCSATSIRALAWLSKGTLSTFAAGGGMAADKGSDQVASNEYVDLDRRQSSSAISRGSMPTPAHHEASSP